jgi:YebC/PmpR family DNA-binding regulatory protein
MSGHSKWATIKRKKAALDSKRGRIFTRLGKEITVVARDGGGDPAFNPRLRLLIDKAKAANMPADNVDRAIKRGTGAVEGASYEFHRYEGYATNGVALIVETLSDNKNRTVADVRHYFSKHGGRLAADGSVSWMFAHKGQVTLAKQGETEDQILEKLLEFDIDEVLEEDDDFKIICPVASLDVVRHASENAGFKVTSAEMIWKAKDHVSTLTDEQTESVANFIDGLEDVDDVQAVFDNLG